MKLQWMKIETDIFDNAKIRRIRRMPGGNDLFVLWVGILTLGMKCQISGRLEISDGLPYSEDDLSNEFDISIDTVKLGLKVFDELKMITKVDGNTIEISNFRRFQNIERIEQVRELARIRQSKRREQLRLTHVEKVKSLNSKDKAKEEAGDRDKDKEEEVSKTKSVSNDSVTRDVKESTKRCEVLEMWNGAVNIPVPKINDISDSRWKYYKVRESEGMSIKEIVKKINESDWLSGRTDKGTWTATFDWVIESPKNWRKIMEGNYLNRRQGSARATAKSGSNTDDFIKRKEAEAIERAKEPVIVPEGF